jgi:hypothetical protein
LHVRTICDIYANGRRGTPGGVDLVGDGVRGCLVEVRNNDLAAFIGNRSTCRAADAAGTPCHDNYSILYAPHADLRR